MSFLLLPMPAHSIGRMAAKWWSGVCHHYTIGWLLNLHAKRVSERLPRLSRRASLMCGALCYVACLSIVPAASGISVGKGEKERGAREA